MTYNLKIVDYSLAKGGGGHSEHIPNFRAILESTDLHQKTDSVHTKMLYRFKSSTFTSSSGLDPRTLGMADQHSNYPTKQE